MTTLMSLPSEVIDIILSYNDISFEDIINFRCVCKQFRNAAKTTDYCFLEKKFFQRWPSAKRYYDKEIEQKEFQENEQRDKKYVHFIETSIYCVRQLRNYTSQTSLSNFGRQLWNYTSETFLSKFGRHKKSKLNRSLYDNLKETEKFGTENYIEILFFMDEIKHILTQPQRPGYDLMEGYCYIKLFDYLCTYWRNFILSKNLDETSHHEELLEESVTILAQQLQPEKDVSYLSVKLSLNIIALEALNFLREKHPNHSIFTTPDECFSDWENGNIDDNYWSEAEGTQIMDTLEEYMFGKLNFRSINSRDLEYTCIDYALKNKCGHNVILFIIYHSVARRLGLRCDLVAYSYAFRSDIILLWVPRYTFSADYKENIINLIDRNSVKCYSHIKFGKFLNYIPKYSGLEVCTLSLCILTYTEILAIYLDWMYKLYSYGIINNNYKIYDKITDKSPKARPHKMKFAVGMIVTHGDKFTDCSRGVIIGWYQHTFGNIFDCKDLKDKAKHVMPLKICGNFNGTEKPIYYIILTKNAKLCLVEEGAITLTKPNWIQNRNIYRYFRKYKGTHYVPNNMLANVYPHDAAIAAKTIFEN